MLDLKFSSCIRTSVIPLYLFIIISPYFLFHLSCKKFLHIKNNLHNILELIILPKNYFIDVIVLRISQYVIQSVNYLLGLFCIFAIIFILDVMLLKGLL